ncbi:hypothetical protein N9Z02_01455, partial [Akkermansiaceae bacterium]|nr:hypothetical protein [Akkermansiaceae bacterium]
MQEAFKLIGFVPSPRELGFAIPVFSPSGSIKDIYIADCSKRDLIKCFHRISSCPSHQIVPYSEKRFIKKSGELMIHIFMSNNGEIIVGKRAEILGTLVEIRPKFSHLENLMEDISFFVESRPIEGKGNYRSSIKFYPKLRIGDYSVSHYDMTFVTLALERAAQSANREDFPFISEIVDGVAHYLEKRCGSREISIEDLFERISAMLQKIGCDSISNHLKVLSPPVHFSTKEFFLRDSSKSIEDFLPNLES